MKKIFFSILCCAAVFASCNQEGERSAFIESPKDVAMTEYILTLESEFDAQVTTRADQPSSLVSSVPTSLYWIATTGTAGSNETIKYNDKASSAQSVTTSGNNKVISTGKYQTNPASSYNWYLANSAITFATSGPTVSVTTDTDAVAGVTKASSSATPSIALKHLFARTGSLTWNKPSTHSSYSLTVNSVTISGGGTSGTCKITDTDNNIWSNVTSPLSNKALSSSSNIYLVPGSYTIKVNYTYSLGDFSATMTKQATISLTGGHVNNISGILPIDVNASPITLTVTLTDWATNTITINDSNLWTNAS